MYTIADVKKIVGKAYIAIEKSKDLLGEMDGNSGDGDLGFSMHSAFQVMNDSAEAFSEMDIGIVLFKMAKECNNVAPSTMGTLVSSGVMALAKYCKSKKCLESSEIILLPRIFTNAIMERGKAKLGDKTILDALIPFCESVESTFGETKDLRKSFQSGALTAEKAAQATSGMRAKIGRAKWLGERAAEYPDAGAMLCAIVVKSFI